MPPELSISHLCRLNAPIDIALEVPFEAMGLISGDNSVVADMMSITKESKQILGSCRQGNADNLPEPRSDRTRACYAFPIPQAKQLEQQRPIAN